MAVNDSNSVAAVCTCFNMEKRRNTLDRFQRLGFGRKISTGTPPPPSSISSDSSTSTTARNSKSSEKSEKLRELTELLRGSRLSPTQTSPPPVPPPRRFRNGIHSTSNSFERLTPPNTNALTTKRAATASLPPLTHTKTLSLENDDIALMDQEEQPPTTTKTKIASIIAKNSISRENSPMKTVHEEESNESFSLSTNRAKSKSPPVPYQSLSNNSTPTKLEKLDERKETLAYGAKSGLPARSASFSQIDYTFGKYRKSTLNAIRDCLRRDKPLENVSTTGTPGSPTTTTTTTAASAIPRSAPNSTNYFGNNTRTQEQKVSVAHSAPGEEPGWIYIPLKENKKSTDNNTRRVQETCNFILEEDVFLSEAELSPMDIKDKPVTATIVASHAKMESLSDTIVSENDYAIEEAFLPAPVELTNSGEKDEDSESRNGINIDSKDKRKPDVIEPNLALLMEEQTPLESPPDNFLQTATTCLIPLPVYECAAQEWRLENPPQEWIEVAPEEFGIVPEKIEPLVTLDEHCIVNIDSKVPVKYSSDAATTVTPPITPQKSLPTRVEQPKPVISRQHSFDYHYEKRYSHDDMEIQKPSFLVTIASRQSSDDRRKEEMSMRRKGMYIADIADWNNSAVNLTDTPTSPPATAPVPLALDIAATRLRDLSNENQHSLNSFELNTPESDYMKSPSWPKPQQFVNLDFQSSEEKDDASTTGNGDIKQNHDKSIGSKSYTCVYLPADSISDNESEQFRQGVQTPSPTRSDVDLKRYSKRPLRGPYGQMLEAEMKKPNKKHFEEILEDLRESDVSPKNRSNQRHAHNESSERNVPQYSKSLRVQKSNPYLPVPAHARASSTPSHSSNVIKNETNTAAVGNDDGGGSDVVGVSGGDAFTDFNHKQIKKTTLSASMQHDEFPKISHHHHQHSVSPHHHHHHSNPRDMKRAASETPVMHHKKVNEKQSTTGSKNTIIPSQALLAELLRGSSEKLLSEQRQQMLMMCSHFFLLDPHLSHCVLQHRGGCSSRKDLIIL